MKQYRIQDTESGKVFRWNLDEIISEINRDRSPSWKPYTKRDWREGWDHFVEGECFNLLGCEATTGAKRL